MTNCQHCQKTFRTDYGRRMHLKVKHGVRLKVVELITRQQEIQIIRVDTGEVLEKRAARADELQPDLFDGAANDGAPPPFGDEDNGAAIAAAQATEPH
jgi:hypothetical protein